MATARIFLSAAMVRRKEGTKKRSRGKDDTIIPLEPMSGTSDKHWNAELEPLDFRRSWSVSRIKPFTLNHLSGTSQELHLFEKPTTIRKTRHFLPTTLDDIFAASSGSMSSYSDHSGMDDVDLLVGEQEEV